MQNEDYGQHHPAGSDVDLTGFEDDYTGAEVEDREFEPVPDGKYQVNVDQVELVRSKRSGKAMLRWTLRILAPRFRGRLLWRNSMIASRENLKWLKTDLHTCGLDLEKLSDLYKQVGQLRGVKLEVSKRTNGEYENVYLNRRLVIEDEREARETVAQDALTPF